MPTPTYVALAKTVLTGTQASVSFSAISGDYTDLVILGVSRSDSTSTIINLTINGNTGTNYSQNRLQGSGSTASANLTSNATAIEFIGQTISTYTTNTFSNFEIYIPSYTSSINKVASISSVTENNDPAALMRVTAGLFRLATPTAISSITLTGVNNFVSGSRFDLYGIKNS